MAETVILSAIEILDCWLLKKGGPVEEKLEKLYSLIVGMSDLGEEKKEMVHSLLLQFGMEENEHERERNKEKLYNFLDFNMENMYSLVVAMADFWEDYKEKLYRLLFWLAEEVDIIEIIDLWGDDEGEFDMEKLHSLLVEIADLWGDDEGEVYKAQRFSLLFQKLKKDHYSNKKNKMMCRISGDKQPKLNKEKLYTWLANNMDLSEAKYLFHVLFDTVLHYDSSYLHKPTLKGVEGAKREFRLILDLITHKKLGEESSLRYFISDVVDMAHHARFLIQLEDSDPFALFFELSAQAFQYEIHHKWFGRKFKHIVRGLQEIKDSMLGFGVERLQNVREIEDGENVVGLEEDVKLLLCDESETTVITGMAGSGKTTLARQVYNHTTIAQQFERRAWVCLSTVLSRKEMLVSLIRQLVDSNELTSLEKIECVDYQSLKQVLRQQLLGMRYFIVLDDMSYNTTLEIS